MSALALQLWQLTALLMLMAVTRGLLGTNRLASWVALGHALLFLRAVLCALVG